MLQCDGGVERVADRIRQPAVAFEARAASSRPQLQKAIPVAAAPFRKFLRVVMKWPPLAG
jgi:hypothetical protein